MLFVKINCKPYVSKELVAILLNSIYVKRRSELRVAQLVSCGGTYPSRIESFTNARIFLDYLVFNRHYYFSSRQHACRQQNIFCGFINFEDLLTPSLRGAHMNWVACASIQTFVLSSEKKKRKKRKSIVTLLFFRFNCLQPQLQCQGSKQCVDKMPA